MSLIFFDWIIIAIYLTGMVALSIFLARGQKNARDYYLGGNKTGPLPIALSTMATQCSTNSLLGAPAFVAFAAGGGILWLQYELAVPFAMIILMAVVFPIFVLKHFPHGMIGLVMAGLIAAAMSSLDSTLNALSALSMQDIVNLFVKRGFSARTELLISKMLTVFWGLVCLAFSFYVGDISQTIIESVNKIGSLINGPLLAVFLMGFFGARVNGPGAIFGLVAGFFGNLCLWKFSPDISWLWWNVIGFLVAYASGYVMSLMFATPESSKLATTTYLAIGLQRSESRIKWRVYYAILALYGTGILIFLIILTRAF